MSFGYKQTWRDATHFHFRFVFLPSFTEWDNSGWLQVFVQDDQTQRRCAFTSDGCCLHGFLSRNLCKYKCCSGCSENLPAVDREQSLIWSKPFFVFFCCCFSILDVRGRIWIHKMMMCQTYLPFEAYNSLKEILFDSCINLLSSVPHFLYMSLCQDYYWLNSLRTTWCDRHVHSHCYNGIKSHFYIFKSNLKEHVSLEDYPKESRNPCFTLALACKCKRRAITLLLVRHRDITGQKVTAEWLWSSEK